MLKPKERLVFQNFDGSIRVQVWERLGRRELRFGNTIVQSAVSLIDPSSILSRYLRGMLLGWAFVPQPISILHIGLGGGILPTFFHQHLPTVSQTVIEINPVIVAVAQQFFNFSVNSQIQVQIQDAVVAVPQLQQQYDLIFLDAFGAEQAATAIHSSYFLQELQQVMTTNAWVIVNLWKYRPEFAAQLEEWKSRFPLIYSCTLAFKGNMLLFACGESACGDFLDFSLAKLKQNVMTLQRQYPVDLIPWLKRLKRLK